VEKFVPPEAVADAIMRLLVHPRRAVYVPRKFWVIPLFEFAFGWLIDRVAVLLIRRQASQA
jgi:hypothetical protein